MIKLGFRIPRPQTEAGLSADASDFERLGGEAGLKAIVEDFLDRVFGDPMIGYLFDQSPKRRVRIQEFRFAAAHLGAEIAYHGKDMVTAHQGHAIFDGHFARRLQLLRETLVAHGVAPDIIERWVAHDAALKGQVVQGSCQ